MKTLLRNNFLSICIVLSLCLCAANWTDPFKKIVTLVAYDSTIENSVTLSGERIEVLDTVALTSPTVTFDVSGMVDVVLSSDANLTAVYPIGGVAGQVVSIRSAATGSNTIQLDDGAKTMIGSSVVLTESQQDSISLRCITAPDVWIGIGAHQN